MNIDDGLDCLTERHEALTQSVEVVLKSSQEHGHRIGALANALTGLSIVGSHENRLIGCKASRIAGSVFRPLPRAILELDPRHNLFLCPF